MRNISSARLLKSTLVLGLLMFCSGQPGSAQTPLPLSLNSNYMVTGDYVVGGWNKTSSTTINGTLMSTGSISIPDATAYGPHAPQQVPTGADIVVAFLYWQTVENSGSHAGQNGYFRGFPITGTILGNPNAPVSWSSGGCAGSSQGSKTIVTYRAEVSSYIPVDANGNVPQNFSLSLPDTGKTSQPPFGSGATLVIIYRVLSSTTPLNAVIIYDGSYAPSNTSQVMTQPMLGFYQAGNDQSMPIVAKITHIVGNGQPNKLESVYLNYYNSAGTLVHSTTLPSLYPGNPPFPGKYNTTWDNATWFVNDPTYTTTPSGPGGVQAGESSESTLVVPASSNKGCVTWGAMILSTTVQDSDHDGLMDTWKQNQGYCDAAAYRGLSTQGTCRIADPTDPFWE